jgi:hypothetical protein
MELKETRKKGRWLNLQEFPKVGLDKIQIILGHPPPPLPSPKKSLQKVS